jgi:hypothetical protein
VIAARIADKIPGALFHGCLPQAVRTILWFSIPVNSGDLALALTVSFPIYLVITDCIGTLYLGLFWKAYLCAF